MAFERVVQGQCWNMPCSLRPNMSKARAHAKVPARHPRKTKTRPALRVVPRPEESGQEKAGGIDELLSGKVTRARPRAKKSRGKKKPTEALPEQLKGLSDVYIAGRKVQKEIDFKVRYAEQQVKEYCTRRFAELYATTGNRPPAVDYQGGQSRFTFIQTARINLTADKAEALREMDLPIDQYTELRGMRINYEAIRSHKLEKKLRTALENMGLSNSILEEIFVPDIQLKESFFEVLDSFVARSVKQGESVEEKLYEVMRVLQPASQVRNADVPGMSAKECFDLIESAEIVLPEGDEELDVA